MRIAIDARVISNKMHGISRYAHNLIIALSKIPHKNEYTLLCSNEEFSNKNQLKNNFKFLPCNVKLYSVKEQFSIPYMLKKEKIDIYHSPTFSAPVFPPCRVIMTIHDMIHLIFPEHYSFMKNLYYKFIVKTAAHRACRIITGSENSKKDIGLFLGIPAEKIHCIYNGVDDRFSQKNFKINKKELMKKYNIPKDYVLYVGNEKPHKNASNVIKAFELFTEKSRLSYSLVLIGISEKFAKKILNHYLPDYFVPVNHINNDADLFSLYQASSLLLCPSRYEGFGLPILEGMACETPVITSKNSSILEVAGDATIMVDPENIEQIADEITRALSDKNLRKDLIEKGKIRASLFTWQKTAQETLKIYKETFLQ